MLNLENWKSKFVKIEGRWKYDSIVNFDASGLKQLKKQYRYMKKLKEEIDAKKYIKPQLL